MSSPATAVESLEPLLRRLRQARTGSDALFTHVAPGALYERSIAERHRLIFYLGHLEAFDWNLLGTGAFQLEPHDPAFDKLFSFGIDPTQGNLPSDVPGDWPGESQIRAYNGECRRRLDAALLPNAESGAAPQLVADGTLLQVAIEHRLMHAETLAYLLHQMPFDKKRGPAASALAPIRPPEHTIKTVRIPRGVATLGQPRPHRDPGSAFSQGEKCPFGWDNEFEATREDVPEFAIDVFPVTNARFLDFLRAGGYDETSLWNAEDWKWKESRNLRYPLFWHRDGNRWFWRGMFELIPLPLDWPVYVSHAEASAFARWAGKSLPSEAQWHRASYGTPQGAERLYPWGDAPPGRAHGNFDAALWDPVSVAAHPAGASAFGVEDLIGNGWEWTSTPFAPFPGFQPFPFYPGYSADFFDGRHFVMKGGSPRTAQCMLRRPFRNWFQPRYPYVYAKFRCVEA